MAFLDTTVVALRESLEALLIIGILMGIVVKAGAPNARRFILWGALAGLAISVGLGFLAQGVARELYEANEALFEGIASLFAVGILTYMIVWMYRHTQGLIGALHAQTKDALASGRAYALAGLAFVAVLREGIETVVFTAAKFPSDPAGTGFGILAGIALSAVLAFLIFAGILRLSLERFMAATGLLLVVIAAGLFAYGFHELREAGLFADPTAEAYDFSAWLPHKVDETGIDTFGEWLGPLLHGLVVYRANPTWLEVGAYLAYLVPMGAWVGSKLVRGRRDGTMQPGEAKGAKKQGTTKAL